MKGQPPKHPNLRIVQGNPGRRKIPKTGPSVEGQPVRPAYLKGRALKIWNEHVPLAPWLTAADSALLGAWCALTVQVETKLLDMPAARLSLWRLMAADLGFTVTSRLRLPAASPPGPSDRGEWYF